MNLFYCPNSCSPCKRQFLPLTQTQSTTAKTSTKTPAFGKGIIRIGLKYSQWALFHQGHHFTVRLVAAITLQPLPEFKRLTEILRLLQRCNGLLLSRHRGGKIP